MDLLRPAGIDGTNRLRPNGFLNRKLIIYTNASIVPIKRDLCVYYMANNTKSREVFDFIEKILDDIDSHYSDLCYLTPEERRESCRVIYSSFLVYQRKFIDNLLSKDQAVPESLLKRDEWTRRYVGVDVSGNLRLK